MTCNNRLVKNIVSSIFVLCAGFLLTTGCIPKAKTGGTVSVISPDFFGIGEEIAQQIDANLRQPMGRGQGVIMTTVVDIDDLYQTSRFGRTLTEAVATRLFRHGFGVSEVRKSAELLIKSSSGELMLTRDATLLAEELEAQAIVAGTYSLTPNSIIVNIKLLDASSNAVLSVAGLEIQRSPNINHLLYGTSGPVAAALSGYER